ncbi:KaiC domain-containing protein [Haloplanus aerogenes]|uniref:KaiC domain protein n=1 Tax=Haloplanus aerogenes TaxID=660522 RepID=A0A3M0CW04_9EURY|nr:KaiC domain-containing protein [Haloplanus aerogenes]AZH26522.1 KaiC domain-containing protein [Haloplanus aerogenes]RMB12750.1 KaiC domain protein [Haloplanus aerogenes]
MTEDEEEDDWFERALREEEESETDTAAETTPDTGTQGFEDLGSDTGETDTEPDSTGSPFDEDFASAFENAPDIGESGLGGSESGGGSGEMVGGSDGAGTGADAGPGGGTPPGGEPTTADPFAGEEADFDTSIARIDLGIEGLDNMILGGVPERSLISVIGSAGTGKTTFGLQFLQKALADGDRGIYLTLEESSDRIYDTAEEKGWSFEAYADEGRLAVVHLDPVEMANSLGSIRNELPELIKDFDADRVVLDSVSLLEMMYDRPAERRSEVYQFSKSLKEAGVTTLVTSEASSDTAYGSRYGIIEYLADAVFILQYVRASDFQETRLAVEIQKIRDANHSRETKPYEITNEGLSVYRQANIF